MVGPLVPGDHAEHLPQALQALPRVARLAEGSLRGLVLGREIGGHDRTDEASYFASLSSGSADDTFIVRVPSISWVCPKRMPAAARKRPPTTNEGLLREALARRAKATDMITPSRPRLLSLVCPCERRSPLRSIRARRRAGQMR